MIDLPSGVPVPKPIDGKEADGVAKGIAQIHLKGGTFREIDSLFNNLIRCRKECSRRSCSPK